MFRTLLTTLLISFLGFFACQSDSHNKKTNEVGISAEDAADLVRSWQRHIDLNEYEEALVISGNNAGIYISYLQALPFEDTELDNPILTEFSSLICHPDQDRQICLYEINDGNETLRDSMIVEKYEGDWVVELPYNILTEIQSMNQ